MDIGQIKTISKNSDDDLVCEIDFGANRVETSTLYGLSNQNEWPLPGDEVVVITDGTTNTIIAVHRATPGSISSGEHISYSRDSDGNAAASIRLSSGGDVVLNDGSDYAVMFGEMKKNWDLQLLEFNKVITALSALKMPIDIGTLTAGPPAPGTFLPSSVSIDTSKVDSVKLPGLGE